jgi:hypothetical protein
VPFLSLPINFKFYTFKYKSRCIFLSYEQGRNHDSAQVGVDGLDLEDVAMCKEEYDAAVAAFIRSKGITRCPTACALPTQAAVPAADRAALESYAATRGRSRQQKIAERQRSFWTAKVLAGPGE